MDTQIQNPPAAKNGHAQLVLQPQDVLPMPYEASRIIARMKAISHIARELFQKDVHVGPPYPGATKKTLLKPGADLLASAFGFYPDFDILPTSVDRGDYIRVDTRCRLIHIESGRLISTAVASANSKEEKYRWKRASKAKLTCPDCGTDGALLKSKDQPEFFCWKKKGGCGSTFPLGDSRIKEQAEKLRGGEERQENDNPQEHHNTLTKISQKRAFVSCIVQALGISSEYTPDGEENPAFTPQDGAGPQVDEFMAGATGEPMGQQAPPPTQAPADDGPTRWEKGFVEDLDREESAAQVSLITAQVLAEIDSCTTVAALTALKKNCVVQGGAAFNDKTKAAFARRHGEITKRGGRK